MIPFVFNDNVLCLYFNKIIDKNKYKKLLEMIIQKKINEKTKKFEIINYFDSIMNSCKFDIQKFDFRNVLLNHNKILRTIIRIFEKNNIELLNLSNIEVYDRDNDYILCNSKYNDPNLVKTLTKMRNISKSINMNHSNIFLNKEGNVFESVSHVYKKLSNFIEKNDIIYLKSYINHVFTEFNLLEKRGREVDEVIVSYVWKMDNGKNIVFNSKEFERDMLEVLSKFTLVDS